MTGETRELDVTLTSGTGTVETKSLPPPPEAPTVPTVRSTWHVEIEATPTSTWQVTILERTLLQQILLIKKGIFPHVFISGAIVTVDGVECTNVGTEGTYYFDLPAGKEVTVETVASGYKNVSHTFTVTADKAQIIELEEGVADIKQNIILIKADSEPPEHIEGATVTVDGDACTEVEGLYSIVLPEGKEVTVTAKAAGYKDKTETFEAVFATSYLMYMEEEEVPPVECSQEIVIRFADEPDKVASVFYTVKGGLPNIPVKSATPFTVLLPQNTQVTVNVGVSEETIDSFHSFRACTGAIEEIPLEVPVPPPPVLITQRILVQEAETFPTKPIEGATVTVNGELCEEYPDGLYTIEIEEGIEATVTVTAAGYKDKTETFTTIGIATLTINLEPPALFTLPPEAELGLTTETITPAIADAFADAGIPLSDDATIEQIDEDTWVVTDGEEQYTIEEEEGVYNVYPGVPPEIPPPPPVPGEAQWDYVEFDTWVDNSNKARIKYKGLDLLAETEYHGVFEIMWPPEVHAGTEINTATPIGHVDIDATMNEGKTVEIRLYEYANGKPSKIIDKRDVAIPMRPVVDQVEVILGPEMLALWQANPTREVHCKELIDYAWPFLAWFPPMFGFETRKGVTDGKAIFTAADGLVLEKEYIFVMYPQFALEEVLKGNAVKFGYTPSVTLTKTNIMEAAICPFFGFDPASIECENEVNEFVDAYYVANTINKLVKGENLLGEPDTADIFDLIFMPVIMVGAAVPFIPVGKIVKTTLGPMMNLIRKANKGPWLAKNQQKIHLALAAGKGASVDEAKKLMAVGKWDDAEKLLDNVVREIDQSPALSATARENMDAWTKGTRKAFADDPGMKTKIDDLTDEAVGGTIFRTHFDEVVKYFDEAAQAGDWVKAKEIWEEGIAGSIDNLIYFDKNLGKASPEFQKMHSLMRFSKLDYTEALKAEGLFTRDVDFLMRHLKGDMAEPWRFYDPLRGITDTEVARIADNLISVGDAKAADVAHNIKALKTTATAQVTGGAVDGTKKAADDLGECTTEEGQKAAGRTGKQAGETIPPNAADEAADAAHKADLNKVKKEPPKAKKKWYSKVFNYAKSTKVWSLYISTCFMAFIVEEGAQLLGFIQMQWDNIIRDAQQYETTEVVLQRCEEAILDVDEKISTINDTLNHWMTVSTIPCFWMRIVYMAYMKANNLKLDTARKRYAYLRDSLQKHVSVGYLETGTIQVITDIPGMRVGLDGEITAHITKKVNGDARAIIHGVGTEPGTIGTKHSVEIFDEEGVYRYDGTSVTVVKDETVDVRFIVTTKPERVAGAESSFVANLALAGGQAALEAQMIPWGTVDPDRWMYGLCTFHCTSSPSGANIWIDLHTQGVLEDTGKITGAYVSDVTASLDHIVEFRHPTKGTKRFVAQSTKADQTLDIHWDYGAEQGTVHFTRDVNDKLADFAPEIWYKKQGGSWTKDPKLGPVRTGYEDVELSEGTYDIEYRYLGVTRCGKPVTVLRGEEVPFSCPLILYLPDQTVVTGVNDVRTTVTGISDGDTIRTTFTDALPNRPSDIQCVRMVGYDAPDRANLDVYADQLMRKLLPIGAPITLKIISYNVLGRLGRVLAGVIKDDGTDVNRKMIESCLVSDPSTSAYTKDLYFNWELEYEKYWKDPESDICLASTDPAEKLYISLIVNTATGKFQIHNRWLPVYAVVTLFKRAEKIGVVDDYMGRVIATNETSGSYDYLDATDLRLVVSSEPITPKNLGIKIETVIISDVVDTYPVNFTSDPATASVLVTPKKLALSRLTSVLRAHRESTPISRHFRRERFR